MFLSTVNCGELKHIGAPRSRPGCLGPRLRGQPGASGPSGKARLRKAGGGRRKSEPPPSGEATEEPAERGRGGGDEEAAPAAPLKCILPSNTPSTYHCISKFDKCAPFKIYICCFPKAGGPDNDSSNNVLREVVLCINPELSFENLSFAAEEKTATELFTGTFFLLQRGC